MTSSKFDRSRFFIDRTLEARTSLPPAVAEPTKVSLPRFWHKSVLLLPGEEFDHVDAYPFIRTPGAIDLLGQTRSGERYLFATNVQDVAQAALLAQARARLLEATMPLYGETDDVLVRFPDDTVEYRYIGKTHN